jgi:hypothetical protein
MLPTLPNHRFQFQKRRQLLIRPHNKTLFRRRDARQQQKSCAGANRRLTHGSTPFALLRLSAIISTSTELHFRVGSAYGSRTRVPALRGLMSSLVYGMALLDCCYKLA